MKNFQENCPQTTTGGVAVLGRPQRTVHFHVTIALGERNTPYQSPELQAAIIAEIIKHRSPHLFGGGGALDVHVTPEEQPQQKENQH